MKKRNQPVFGLFLTFSCVSVSGAQTHRGEEGLAESNGRGVRLQTVSLRTGRRKSNATECGGQPSHRHEVKTLLLLLLLHYQFVLVCLYQKARLNNKPIQTVASLQNYLSCFPGMKNSQSVQSWPQMLSTLAAKTSLAYLE